MLDIEMIDRILTDANLFYAFRLGVAFGVLAGAIGCIAITRLFLSSWSVRIYEQGVRDAQHGWRGVNGGTHDNDTW